MNRPPHPPLDLVFGAPALDLAYKKLDKVKQDLDTWREMTLSADLPESKE